MIGETTMKCKYIDQKIPKLQTQMCLVLLVTALQLTVLVLSIRAMSPKMNSRLNILYRFYLGAGCTHFWLYIVDA